MRQAIIDGIVLEYAAVGAGEPVVLIHGAFIADTFRTMVEEPGLRGYRLITYRRRGYVGSSRSMRPLSIAEQAADCHALLRYLGVERVHAVGHSFGGAVALQLALDFPDMAHSLALLEPALMFGATAQSYRESLEQAIRRYGEADTASVVDGFLKARWPEYHFHLEKVLPGAFTQAVADAGTTFGVELPGLLDWSFSEKEVSLVSQPVLSVLGGESERLWPRFGEVHRLLLAQLPNVEGFILPNAPHFLQVENPRDMAEALATFFKRNPLAT
jgi:pimeloyl-ACP methyl ester carboxylesterase